MTTGVSICSNALLQLGKKPINDFNEPGDLARLCVNLYAGERDSLLRENDWTFATKREVLAPLAAKPAFGFAAQFAKPADFLRLISIGDRHIASPQCMRFKVEGPNILASGTQLAIVYVWRNENESTWDSKAVELLTARMLWKLAYPVTQSTTLRDTLRDEYTRMAQVARSIDSSENPSESLSDDFTLLTGRM